jgi:hypothetical protein
LKPNVYRDKALEPRRPGRPRKESAAAAAEVAARPEGGGTSSGSRVETGTPAMASSAAAAAADEDLEMGVELRGGEDVIEHMDVETGAGEDPGPSNKRARRAAVAAVVEKVLAEYQPTVVGGGGMLLKRSAESLRESRMAEIEKWHERGVVRRWTRAEAVKTGARIFQARWVDDPMKCKSRYVIKEYANQKDLSVFAAASDFATSRLVDYKAVRCGYPTFVFDVTSAYTHADEDEQVFLEPPEEEKAIHGDCLWESVKVIYGRRKGARSWQDHFVSVVQSPEAVEAGFTVKVHEKCPTMFYLVEADGLFELHVDDGHGTGRPDVIRKFLEYISQKIELKWVDGLKEGMSYEYLKTIKYRTNEGIWSIPSEKYIDSALERFGMTGCNPSSSPKVSKAEEPGDQSPVTEETASGFRSSVSDLVVHGE